MSVVTAEPITPHLMLSTRLVSELGDPRSTLRATTDRNGAAVLIHAGGEVDACNEHTWRQLLTETAAGVPHEGLFVVDITGLDFMGCCAYAVLADEADRCRRRGAELRLVTPHSTVARIVAACGFSDLLPVYPTVDSALRSRW
ncbi:anti-anti-sigma factor [Mycobacterium kansasii]|uniref:Anti-sigma factor antagonist n=1 Tax=Mycobacterium attenuatum TaxID=2341086 RepID=A0A498PY18_9MYCO|nr:anti-sigma factor antagonist [Mycobacterium attenuatum]ORB86563.1 anti-anti-sigma factor [Mycobacterium kansasii]VBA37659.1 Anti-sigma-F factor antagonist RsfA [Mycobacterium attenuatum]VBA56646.1 Anti-sigma-F factor antagonist RsfA [Mycobacterium attenuatum]